MKKMYFWSLLTFMMVAMLSIGVASCGSDDDDDGNSINNQLIVGTWQSTHEIIYNADGSISYERTTVSTIKEIFREDGTYTMTDGYNSENAQWSISGNRLSFTYSRKTENYTIQSLNESTMVLQYDDYSDGRRSVVTYKKISVE